MYSFHIISILALLFRVVLATAIESREKWSEIYNSSSLYYELPKCAQDCVASVDNDLSGWSYGCVCSEKTLGNNFINGTEYIRSCVHRSCSESGEIVANNALNAFQSVCGLDYFDFNTTATVRATVTLTASPTPTFDGKWTADLNLVQRYRVLKRPESNVIMIDTPDESYDALDPCIRWVFNGCESPKDNSENCKPSRPGDHSEIWSGLGHYLRCSTTECVCGGSMFFYSTQKLYERADLYCSVGFPYDGNPNENFQLTIAMLANYCSSEGYVLGKWIVTLFGKVKKAGMST